MKYIYKVGLVGAQGANPETIQTKLNDLARDGFRCIHPQFNPNGSWTLIFEKEQEQ